MAAKMERKRFEKPDETRAFGKGSLRSLQSAITPLAGRYSNPDGVGRNT